MRELEQALSQLIQEACACDRSSPERQQHLNQLIRQLLASGRVWRRADIPEADFQDILQKSWIYLCCNLCEATTAATAYDPTRSSVITWINAYIKMRVLDYYLEREREQKMRVNVREGEDGDLIDPIVGIPAPGEPPPMLQEILNWLERESSRLCRIYLRDRPDINCKTLILCRLPHQQVKWNQLAQEFGVTANTLQKFYRQKCLPQLREAGKQLGYL